MNEGVMIELLLTLGCARASERSPPSDSLWRATDCSGSSKPQRAGNKSPRRTTRKGAINLHDRGLFPPLLTYFREEDGGREERFMEKAADCVLNLPAHVNSLVRQPPTWQKEIQSRNKI